jgi:hypothetical protein
LCRGKSAREGEVVQREECAYGGVVRESLHKREFIKWISFKGVKLDGLKVHYEIGGSEEHNIVQRKRFVWSMEECF